MTKLTFFHQKRRDTAIRTGIEVNDETVLSRFSPGGNERDSALLWYVDVRCESTTAIPADAPNARNFFFRNERPISEALKRAAEDLRVGLDADIWPLRHQILGLSSGISGEIACSAMRRIANEEISNVLIDLSNKWQTILNELHEPAEAVH